jgi:molybdate transport system substrate-binding protein
MKRAVGLALAGWVAVSAGGKPPRELVVYAAADLVLAFREIVPAFERAQGVKVTLVLGSTGLLARQIEEGAPADVFFAADEAFIDRLERGGRLVPGTRALYAQGRLSLVWRQGARAIDGLAGLREGAIRRIAIAHPAHAPYGRAAEEALRRAGLLDTVRDKLVYGENVRQALQFVEAGGADAGIVARSIADAPGIASLPIDPAMHAPINQAVGVARRSAVPDLARAFIAFVDGATARAIMRRFGFLVPGEF